LVNDPDAEGRLMLILTPDTPLDAPATPRLDFVLGELGKEFRPKRRPHRADPDSPRNDFVAMCRRCDWQRPDCRDSKSAADIAQAHEKDRHGVMDGGLVRVEMR
jgi:hypothetical protein